MQCLLIYLVPYILIKKTILRTCPFCKVGSRSKNSCRLVRPISGLAQQFLELDPTLQIGLVLKIDILVFMYVCKTSLIIGYNTTFVYNSYVENISVHFGINIQIRIWRYTFCQKNKKRIRTKKTIIHITYY